MSDEVCFWGGFASGALAALFLVFVSFVILETARNNYSEILRIEYKNLNNGASRELVENMVKTQFPSSKWENVEYDCSKIRAKVEFSNP